MTSHDSTDPDTWVLHGDTRPIGERTVAPSIPYSATFIAEDESDFAGMATTPRHSSYYTRYGNPLHARVAELVAGLEHAEAGLCFSSGMAGISNVALSVLRSGDHVVAQTNHYMGTNVLFGEVLSRLGIRVTFVDQTDTDAFAAARCADTRLVHVETPANPTMALTDITAVAELAHEVGALLTVDNTFASPINQRPITLGADVVMHSATKALGGHHDLTGGVVVTTDELCDQIWRTAVALGPTMSPMDAWLLLRGLRTLPTRVRQQNETTSKVARFLEDHPKVAAVHYPGLPSHPQYELAQRQMRGFGTVLAIELADGYAAAQRFVGNLQVFTHAVSLGGVESLAVHAASMWAGTLDETQMRAASISPALVRLSIGLEHGDALCEDLDSALR